MATHSPAGGRVSTFFAETQGLCRVEYEVIRRRLGGRSEQIWHQLTPHGTFAVEYVELDHPGELTTEHNHFVTWSRAKIVAIQAWPSANRYQERRMSSCMNDAAPDAEVRIGLRVP